MDELLRVDRDEWAAEVPEIRAFFDRFGDRLPGSLNRSLDVVVAAGHHRRGLTAAACAGSQAPPASGPALQRPRCMIES